MKKITKEERKTKQIEYSEKMVEYMPVLRTAAQLTQNQLAKRLAVTRATIINIENKKRPLQFHMYLAMILIFMQYQNSNELIKRLYLFDKEFILSLN